MIELEKKLKERTEEITTLERELKILQIEVKSKSRLKGISKSSSQEDDGKVYTFIVKALVILGRDY